MTKKTEQHVIARRLNALDSDVVAQRLEDGEGSKAKSSRTQAAAARGKTRREAALDRLTAYHEAGHAVAHIHLHIRFKKVMLCHPKTGGGLLKGTHIPVLSGAAWHRWLEDHVVTLFAGPLAERRYAPRSNWREGMGHDGVQKLYYGEDDVVSYVKAARASDLEYIRRNLEGLGYHSEARDAYQSKLETRAKALVKQFWPEIQCVAAALLKKKVLTQAEVRRLMIRARRPPRRLSSFRARRTKEFDK
jgi:ATP-dependent Zn protease